MASAGLREHHVSKQQIHYKWDKTNAPAVEVEPGDVIHFETEEVTSGQIKKGDPAAKLTQLDFNKLYPLGGPVYVKGAEAGDVLEVEILDLKPGAWGLTGVIPGLRLLPADFPDPELRDFDLRDR